MPSSYVPPDVYVEQRRRTVVGAARPPSLPVVVVGPAVQIETRKSAGSYDATVELLVPIPGLTAGGLVRESSIEILLEAQSDSGRALGLFLLSPSEYETVTDSEGNITQLRILGDLALELSILSRRNNDLVDGNSDFGSGTPDGIFFTDTAVDFLARGASTSGDTFIQISAPASMAGVYRIVEMYPTNSVVNRVMIEKVLLTDYDVPELVQSFTVDGMSPPNSSVIYGIPADHEQLSAPFSRTNNVAIGADPGVGVSGIVGLEDAAGNPATSWGSAEVTALLTGATTILRIPGTNSNASLEFAPIQSVGETAVNRNLAFWQAMVAGVEVGNWMRITLSTGPVKRDFKILAVDTVNYALVISAMGSTTVADVDISNPADITSIEFFEVLKGRQDNVNGAGDYITMSLSGVAEAREILSATPTALAFVTALPSFEDVEVEIQAAQSVISITAVGVIELPSVNAGWAGLWLRLEGNANPANNGDYTILSVDTLGNTVTIDVSGNTSWTDTGTGSASVFEYADTSVTLRRGIPFRNSSATYDLRKRLTDGFVANVLVSYVADRRDLPLNGLVELASRQDIEAVLGQIHPDNPLALGCDMVVRSGLADGNRTFYALATNGDTLAGHMEAMETLETEDVYYVVPLTQDEAIISAYKAHVGVQSQPRNKHERVVLVSTALPTEDSILPSAGEAAPEGTIVTASTISSTANLGSLNPGDVVKILTGSGAVEISRRIVSINVGTGVITLLEPLPAAYVGTTRTFRVDSYPLTKDEQAEAWRDYAASVKDFRVMVIRPDQIEITYTDKTLPQIRDLTVTVGAEYACCAFAGLAAALPVESPLTNVPIPGISRLIHSSGYFKPSQMDTIAEGGNNLLVQETRNSIPYSRHQLTTDMTSIITREFSITKIVDFTAKFVRNSLKPFIGNRNITQEYLTQLRGTTEAILRALTRANILLAKTQLLVLKQNPDEPDSIIIELALDVPYPANRIFVTLYV